MDFISLPEYLKLQIFKELDWKCLMNLKVVCRNFYLTIEKNIQSLDRPKVDRIKIFYGKYRILRIEYDLKSTENTLRDGNLKVIEFNSDDEYENFLKDKDFTELKELLLQNVANDEYIKVTDESDSNEGSFVYFFDAMLPN